MQGKKWALSFVCKFACVYFYVFASVVIALSLSRCTTDRQETGNRKKVRKTLELQWNVAEKTPDRYRPIGITDIL
jgi:hypothetical protein